MRMVGNPTPKVTDWPSFNKGRALHRFCHLPPFDQIGFACGKNEFPIGDVYLSPTKRDGIESMVNRPNDILRIRLASQHKGVRHAGKHHALITFAASVTGQWYAQQMRV